MNVCLLVIGLACGGDSDDRMVRRYAKCMTDTNTTLHRLTVSSALGTVPLRRRGDGGTVAWSTGERGVHHGGRSGPTTPATVNRSRRELREERGRKALGTRRSPVSEWSPPG